MPKSRSKKSISKKIKLKSSPFFRSKKILVIIFAFVIIGIIALRLVFASEGISFSFNSPGIHHDNGEPAGLYWKVTRNASTTNPNDFAWWGPKENHAGVLLGSPYRMQVCYYFAHWTNSTQIWVDVARNGVAMPGAFRLITGHDLTVNSYPGSKCVIATLDSGWNYGMEYRIKVLNVGSDYLLINSVAYTFI